MKNVQKPVLAYKNSAKCTKPRYWHWSADAFLPLHQCLMVIDLQISLHRLPFKRLDIPSVPAEIVISLETCHFKRFACFMP